MLNQIQIQRAAGFLPFLADPRREIGREFARLAVVGRFSAGQTVFSEGDSCTAFSILLSGGVRVFKIGETGREITLYRFSQGESCILTANCILSRQQFPAIAVVEQDCEAVVVPHEVFQSWVDAYPPWREYVFDMLSRRLATMMAVVDEVAFRRMDIRVAEWLLRQPPGDQDVLRLTHQQIAADLGTSREVVSRILEEFAANKLIRTARGAVAILDRPGLAARAAAR